MTQEIPNAAHMLAVITQQEDALQFDRFTFEDGWKLGLILRERALAHGGNTAMDITVGGVQLFRCVAGYPTPNNTRWIRRKMNVTAENWKSSLRVTLEISQSERTLDEYGLKAEDYALSGGCFPIRLRGQGMIGTVTVSGLPQTHDHQTVVDAMAQFLGISVPSVLD
ncbi:MAG TPA: heme-degrading domain-containing protein [Candidatus Limiplasma sp.]|nr:heme-degrading domain-containing protein [Candidatus Limiplasma sp.]HPS81045.1 heme-degrading domain-containing protein [Candidatus Limiplasma sp.]